MPPKKTLKRKSRKGRRRNAQGTRVPKTPLAAIVPVSSPTLSLKAPLSARVAVSSPTLSLKAPLSARAPSALTPSLKAPLSARAPSALTPSLKASSVSPPSNSSKKKTKIKKAKRKK